MMNTPIIPITIVAIIIIIFLCTNNDTFKQSSYNEQYRNSNGTFDKYAAKTAKIIESISNPTEKDFFTHGRLYEMNLLESNVDARGPYANTIINDYKKALNKIKTGNITRQPQKRQEADFIVNKIEDFANKLRLSNFEQDININTPPNFWLPHNPAVGGLETELPRVNQLLISGKKSEALAGAETKLDVATNYLELSKNNTSDSQNVHDHSVIKDLTATIAAIRRTYSGKPAKQNLAEIEAYLLSDSNEGRRANAMRTLKLARGGNTIAAYGETEDKILAMVWERSNLEYNRDNGELIKEAIRQALSDCIENGAEVCISGRTARIISALTLLDYNDDVGAAQTSEAYKNEILDKAKQILDREIAIAKSSDDAELKKIGESYEDTSGTVIVSEIEEKKFIEKIKSLYSQMIDGYKDKFLPNKLNKIKEECYSAL